MASCIAAWAWSNFEKLGLNRSQLNTRRAGTVPNTTIFKNINIKAPPVWQRETRLLPRLRLYSQARGTMLALPACTKRWLREPPIELGLKTNRKWRPQVAYRDASDNADRHAWVQGVWCQFRPFTSLPVLWPWISYRGLRAPNARQHAINFRPWTHDCRLALIDDRRVVGRARYLSCVTTTLNQGLDLMRERVCAARPT